MNYPFWDVPVLGSGWIIGIIAIIHVMFSHFAVGGGLYLALAERKALKENNQQWLEILRGHAKFFLLLTGIAGTTTGVGIWFAIGLAHPEATSTLIHNFVFGWAIEWVFFIIELTTVAVYYYTWGRISNELHLKVGYLYAISSFFTLFIINGILTFMLTPGATWLSVAGTGTEASKFWNAFFNPTFWPSLFIRFAVCCSLAGAWALLTFGAVDGEKFRQAKSAMVRYSTMWLLPAFLALPFLMVWYLYQVPEAQRALLQIGVHTMNPGLFSQVTRSALLVVCSSATILAVIYLFAWRFPAELNRAQASVVLILALIATGSTEHAREMLRKPFVIGQHMFSNGVRKAWVDRYNQEGYLTKSMWTPKAGVANVTPEQLNLLRGQAMFRGQCLSCHTLDGYRPIRKFLAGRDRKSVGTFLAILRDYKPDSPYRAYMPPLVGKAEEVEALGDYLAHAIASPTNAVPVAPAVVQR